MTPTVREGTPTFKAGESYTCTGQVFMRNIGLEFCNRKTLCTTANFNLQESQHALIHIRCKMVMYPDIGMYTEANTCRISTTHNNAREGKAMKEEIENITGPRTPGAWLYAWAAIAAKYNEREKSYVLMTK